MEKIALAIYGQPYGELPLFERCAVAWAYASQYVSAAAMAFVGLALARDRMLERGKVARRVPACPRKPIRKRRPGLPRPRKALRKRGWKR